MRRLFSGSYFQCLLVCVSGHQSAPGRVVLVYISLIVCSSLMLLHSRVPRVPQNLADDPEEEKTKQQQHIQNLHAFDLFTKKQFKDAMNIFLELNTGKETVRLKGCDAECVK